MRCAEAHADLRAGVTTDERHQLRQLQKEVKDVRRANVILTKAATLFGAELDRRRQP